MKKLLNTLFAAVVTAAMLTACGNEANMGEIVIVDTLEEQSIVEKVSANGSVEGNTNTYTVSAKTDSYRVKELYVSVGDSVKKGDKLLELDTEDIENKIAVLEKKSNDNSALDEQSLSSKKRQLEYLKESQAAKLNGIESAISRSQQKYDEANDKYQNAINCQNEAQSNYDDAKVQLESAENEEDIAYYSGLCELYQSQISSYSMESETYYAQMTEYMSSISSSESEYDLAKMETDHQIEQMQFEIDSYQSSDKDSESELEKLKDALDNSVFYAPCDGVITQVNVEKGKYGSEGNLVTILDDTTKVIHTSLSESDILSVTEGMKVNFYLSANSSKIMEGEVIKINHIKGENGFDVYISSDDVDNMNIGMSVVNDIIILEDNALAVKKGALHQREDDDSYYVYTAEPTSDGKFIIKEHSVETGISNNEFTAITANDLSSGDMIVSVSYSELYDGMTVDSAVNAADINNDARQ